MLVSIFNDVIGPVMRGPSSSHCAAALRIGRLARDLIGGTPLIRLHSLSAATCCEILAKAEFLNPGGSSKDRVALAMVREAEASGKLHPGGTVVEATAGSTGVSLALVARACGYKCLLVAADDTSPEKLRLIRALGARLEVVRPASIADPDHPVNVARRRAAELFRRLGVTIDLEAPVSGRLVAQFFDEDATVVTGAVIAEFEVAE